jgi:beta-galactosidase GanA
MTIHRAGTRPIDDGVAVVERQLQIDGTPFLVLGGELHNSSSSTKSDLDARWARITALGLNTVLAAVSWELIEPVEGQFDFSTVDFLIEGARANNLKVVPLWFGSWKNGLSSYRPSWVKRDPERFPLVRAQEGSPVQVLSVFSENNRDADARAFAALMRHIKEVDADQKTVIMVQVENEVGILGPSRDHGAGAAAAYAADVDPAFLDFLREDTSRLKPAIAHAVAGETPGGSWEAIFGESLETDELFQDLGYARYVDAVVAAGRAEYELPYFVNTWLDSPEYSPERSRFAPYGGQIPGNYPSGGPLPQAFGAWLYGAPNVTMLTPDIYFGDFTEWCRRYSASDVGFFIPEMKIDAAGIAGIHIAIGSFGAIGTSPFGIDGNDGEYAPEHKALLATSYRALANLADVILAAQRRGEIVGFELTSERPEVVAEFGGHRLKIIRDRDDGSGAILPNAWGLVATDGEGGYAGTGAGFSVTFESFTEGRTAALERVESGRFEAGTWVTEQVLNGDETLSGEIWRFPAFAVIPGISFGEAFPSVRVLRATVYEY